MDSHALAAERLQIARILLNFGHSYLRTTSVECSEDEEEEEEKHGEEEGAKEKHIEEDKGDQNELKSNFETLDINQSTENVPQNFEEEMQVNDELQQVDNEKQFEIDNECSVNVLKKSDLSWEKLKDFKCENVKKLKSKKVQTKLDSKRPKMTDENEETESDSVTQINTEFNEEIPEHNKDYQQMSENYVNVKLDIEVDSDFEQELHENMSQEYDSEKQLSDEDIYIQLNIELPININSNTENLEPFQLLETNAKQEEQQNNCKDVNEIEIGKVKQIFKNKLFQNVDSQKQPPHVELDCTNTIIEGDVLHQIAREVHKESDVSLKHYEEKQEINIPTIHRFFSKEMHNSSDSIDFYEKEQTEFIEKQQTIRNSQQSVDLENLFECNEKVQKQCDPQKKKVVKDVQKEFNDKCNEKVLNCFNNESQNVECKFNMDVQSNSEIELKSREGHNNKYQNKGEYKTLKMFDKQIECTVNSDMQTDDNNFQILLDDQSNVQEFEKVSQVHINKESKNNIEKGRQIELGENIQLQFDKEVEQELKNDFQVKFKSEIDLLELELKDEKKLKKEMIEKFQEVTKKVLDKHTSELFDSRHDVADESQYSTKGETHENLIGQVQQELEALQIEADKFDYEQDEELDRTINKKLEETYSSLGQVNIIEKLHLLLNQGSSVINDRLNTICYQFFQEFNNASQIDSEKVTEKILNAKVDRIFKQESQKCINVKEQDVNTNLIQVAEKNIQSEFNEKDLQVNLVDKNNVDNRDKAQEEILEISQETVNQHFDVVIMFNSGVQQEDSIRQCGANEKVQIEFNEKILKKFQENAELNVDESQKQPIDKQILLVQGQHFDGKTLQDIEENKQIEFYEDIQQEVSETELNLSEGIQFDNNKQLQQNLNKNVKEILNQDIHNTVHLELEFFRSSQENNLQSKIDLESLKKKLFQNYGKIKESGVKIVHFEKKLDEKDESNLSGDEFEKINLAFVEQENKTQKKIVEDVQEESSDVDIEGFDSNEDQVYNNVIEYTEELLDEFKVSILSDSESDKLSKESDVDIERFEDKTLGNLNYFQKKSEEVEIKNMVDANFEKCIENESELCMDKFKERQSSSNEEFQLNIGGKTEEELLFEKNEKLKFEVLNLSEETNEVVEIVEDIEIKSDLSVNSVSNTDNDSIYSEESSSSESLCPEESSSTEGSSLDMNPRVIQNSSSDESSSNSSLINILNSTYIQLSSSEAESSSSETELSFREELFGSEEEFSSTEEKGNSTDNEEDFSDEFEDIILEVQHCNSEEMDNEVFQNFDEKSRSSELYKRSLHEVKNKQYKFKRQSKLEEKRRKKFEDLQMKMDIRNIKNLDEIPLAFKLQQEQFEKDLHLQLKKFQKEFYKDSKLEYDQQTEIQLNDNYECNAESSQVFDEQQQTFYKLKDEFHSIEQNYESLVQQKLFEKLQDVDNVTVLETENCPEHFNNVINVVDEDIHKEFVELKRDCHELEPEFKYNVPLDFEEDNLSQNLSSKPYNLLERLYCKHRQKLCEFADAKTWPENRLYPSSLLDQLFEDPLEFKPNVIVITLYSIDIGYSVKITMKKNQPPIETFFNYADDPVLDFVEQEELPPILLETLDRAEPQLFYNGCIIAEIHNKFKGVLNGVYRVLLRPSNLSIQCDVKRIIAENSHINWTYNRRLKLEKTILKACNPAICIEASPIAGLAVQLQHQMLSARTFVLNPLKCKHIPSKLKSAIRDSSDNLFDNTLSSETQSESSESRDVASDSEVHHLLWKFDFRLISIKVLKLYVLRMAETQEHSMLLSTNLTAESAVNIRFKVNLETNELKTYIHVILDILKEKVSSNMVVVRKYKNDSKSSDLFLSCAPTLFSDNIYDPNYADINQLINTLFKQNSEYQFFKTDIENKKIESSLLPSQLSNDLQETDQTDKNLLNIDPQIDQMTKNIQFCSTQKLLDNPLNYFESFKEQANTDHQLDQQRKKAKYDNLLSASSSSLEVTLPSVIVPSTLNHSENQTHEHSLEETKYISSPNIFNHSGIKRKRTLS